MRVFRHFLVTLVIALLVPAASDAENGGATAVDKAPKFLRIPVFFVTDRNKSQDSTTTRPEFGTERQYLSHCKHDYAMGAAAITIQNTHKKTITPALQELGWKEDTETSEGYRTGDLVTGAPHGALKEKFTNSLVAYAQKTPDHQALLFVPGYMSTFDSGLISAARFAYYSERPVVLFSWASKGEFKAYSADEATIEWCQYHFNDFLRAMQAAAQKDPSFRLRMMAHSMGTRLPVRASDRFPGATFCNEVALVCPDVDDGLVGHYMGDVTVMKAGQGAPTVRLYMSRKDKMLGLSQRVHGGYERTGKQKELDPKLMKEGQEEDLSAPPTEEEKAAAAAEATDENGSAEGTASAAAGGTAEGSSEAAVTATGGGAPGGGEISKKKLKDAPGTNLANVEDRFQMIDFTAIDTGKVGHKIPVEIICNVSKTGEPGQGWKLVSEVPAKANGGSATANGGSGMAAGSADSSTRLVAVESQSADPEVMKGEPEKAYFILVSTAPPSRRPIRRIISPPRILPKKLKNKDWTLK